MAVVSMMPPPKQAGHLTSSGSVEGGWLGATGAGTLPVPLHLVQIACIVSKFRNQSKGTCRRQVHRLAGGRSLTNPSFN